MSKVIQTFYNGYHFRSRTEARWAVFFDAIGFGYQYEPEGFVFYVGNEKVTYLPDFFINDFDLYIEIKHENFEKETAYTELMLKLLNFDKPVAVLCGPPKNGIQMHLPVWEIDCDSGMKTGQWYIEKSFFANSGDWYLNWTNDDELSFMSDIGLHASRKARFEHGEKPFKGAKE